MFTAWHSPDIDACLAACDEDEAIDYFRRLVPDVKRDPFSHTSHYGIGGKAYRLGRFGRGRAVLIKVDLARQALWFLRCV